jgi:signal transduction histidine kinase
MARRAVHAGSVAWDVAVAALVLCVALLGTPAVAHRQAVPGLDPLGYVLLTAAGAPLVWWRRRPLVTFIVTCLAVTLYLGLGYPWGPILVAEPIAVYGLSRRCPPRQTVTWLGALLAATALAVVIRVTAGPEGWDWAGLGALLAWAALPAAAGIVTRVRRHLAANLRTERARLAATEERLRVAQEVHDVVGHGQAVIAMQSGVALHVLQRDPEKARAPLEAIRATSLDSLTRGPRPVRASRCGATARSSKST